MAWFEKEMDYARSQLTQVLRGVERYCIYVSLGIQ